jgi:hypothetical protein
VAAIRDDINKSADWISRALNNSGYQADFSPQSLWEIDRFLDDHSQNGSAKPGGLLSEDLGSRIFAIESYMGEVVRRSAGGDWFGDDSGPEAELTVELRLPSGTRCWPVQRAMKRLKNGAEDSIAAWGSGIGLQVGPRPKLRKGLLRRLLG